LVLEQTIGFSINIPNFRTVLDFVWEAAGTKTDTVLLNEYQYNGPFASEIGG